MNNGSSFCQLDEPKCSFGAIPIGILIVFITLGLIDFLWIDMVADFGTLQWLRNVFGVLSGNEAPLDHIAWVYLIIIASLFVVGAVAVVWWKALISGIAVPLIFGIAYALLGMSFGEPVLLQEIFINPMFFSLPYFVPALASSIAVSVLLSQKTAIWTEKLVSTLK